MNKYFKYKLLLIVAVIVFSVWKAYPPQEKIALGLDLQGGIHIALRVDLEKIPEAARKDAVDRAVEIIRNRIDQFGVKEPSIQKQGRDQIIVQLPGVTDRKRAAAIIGRTALLEFKLVTDDLTLAEKAKESGVAPEGYELKELKGPAGSETLLLHKEAALRGDRLVNAGVTFSQSAMGQPVVNLEFDKEGAKTFSDVTTNASNLLRKDGIPRRLAIVLDGEIRSAPQIKEPIPNGQAVITGNFSYQEASDLALVLRAGALPAPVEIMEDRTVGPTLGQDSVRQGVMAAVGSAIAVSLFMLVYYLFPGIVANIALVMNVLILMGIMATLGSALTLPGIAGIVLTIGMAVDANVLIFERIREELRAGRSSRAAISAGYHRAFTAILDSNVTTIITALLLLMFGTGPVKGFAVTLTFGLLASMFTAIFVTRTIFDWLFRGKHEISLKMLNFLPHTPKVDFVKVRFFTYLLSLIVIIGGMAFFAHRGRGMLGVDFSGGTLEQVKFHEKVDIGTIRKDISSEGVKDPQIQNFGSSGENEIIIRTAANDVDNVNKALDKAVGQDHYDVLRVETVGPAASNALFSKAIKAVLWGLLGILVYMTWRFNFKYAICGVVAVLHDVLIALGLYALTGRELSIIAISAILTVIGYSINDTIVIFDRIRENLKLMRKAPYKDVVNMSVNQTLSRTILTSLTVFIVVASLYVFGGPVINDFAFIMLIGVFTGTFSTVYVASALMVDWSGKR